MVADYKNYIPRVPGLRQSAFNVGSGWVNKIVSMLASLLVTGLAIREYGLDGMGLIIVATQVASYAALIEVGIPASLSRRLPAYLASEDEACVNAFCSSCLVILLSGALLLLISIPFIVLFLPEAFSFTEEQKDVAGVLFGITVAFAALQLPLRMGYGILSSTHKFSYFFSIETLAFIAKILLVGALLLVFDPPIWVYVLASLSPALLATATEFVVSRRLVGLWRFSFQHLSRGALSELLSLSGAVMIGTLATAIVVHGGSLVLATTATPSEVVEYALPVILAFNLMSFAAGASAFLSPIASQLAGRDEARLRETVLTATRYSFAVATLICLITWTAGPTVLTIWLGNENLQGDTLGTMSTILLIAVVGGALSSPGAMGRGVLVAMGQHWTVSRIELGSGLAGLAGGLALGAVFGNLPLMFAVAFCGAAVVKGMLLLRLLARVLHVPRSAFVSLATSVSMPLILSLPALVLLEATLPLQGVIVVAIETVIVSAIFVVSSLYLVIERRHRAALFAKVSALVS